MILMLSNSSLNNFILLLIGIFYNQLCCRDEFYNKIHIKLRHEQPTVEITFTYHLSSHHHIMQRILDKRRFKEPQTTHLHLSGAVKNNPHQKLPFIIYRTMT